MKILILILGSLLAANATFSTQTDRSSTFLSASTIEQEAAAIQEGETTSDTSTSMAQTEWWWKPKPKKDLTKDLDDDHLLRLLWAACEDVYHGQGNTYGDRIHLLEFNEDDFWLSRDYRLQFGIYEINEGEHKGKKIMAMAGLHGVETMFAAMDVWLGSMGSTKQMKKRIEDAVEIAEDRGVDFIAGHSLGGILSESVCSYTGLPGASFDAPGNYRPGKKSNLCDGGKHKGVRFEAHLMTGDWFSHDGYNEHIAEPKWHTTMQSFLIMPIPHLWDAMWNALGRF